MPKYSRCKTESAGLRSSRHPRRDDECDINTGGSIYLCPLESSNHIRILTLQPHEDAEQPLRCSVQSIDISTFDVSYRAISYTWASIFTSTLHVDGGGYDSSGGTDRTERSLDLVPTVKAFETFLRLLYFRCLGIIEEVVVVSMTSPAAAVSWDSLTPPRGLRCSRCSSCGLRGHSRALSASVITSSIC